MILSDCAVGKNRNITKNNSTTKLSSVTWFYRRLKLFISKLFLYWNNVCALLSFRPVILLVPYFLNVLEVKLLQMIIHHISNKSRCLYGDKLNSRFNAHSHDRQSTVEKVINFKRFNSAITNTYWNFISDKVVQGRCRLKQSWLWKYGYMSACTCLHEWL